MKTRSLTNKAGDARVLTRKSVKQFRTARSVDPALVAAYEKGTLKYRGQRGAQKAPRKIQINIRFSPEVIAFFKAKGHGWQTRMDDTLRAIVEAAR